MKIDTILKAASIFEKVADESDPSKPNPLPTPGGGPIGSPAPQDPSPLDSDSADDMSMSKDQLQPGHVAYALRNFVTSDNGTLNVNFEKAKRFFNAKLTQYQQASASYNAYSGKSLTDAQMKEAQAVLQTVQKLEAELEAMAGDYSLTVVVNPNGSVQSRIGQKLAESGISQQAISSKVAPIMSSSFSTASPITWNAFANDFLEF